MSNNSLDIYIHVVPPAGHEAAILAAIQQLQRKIDIMATSLDDTIAAVTAEDTKIDSLLALVDGIKAQLADALAGVNLPPAVQAKVDAVFAGITASSDKVQKAIDANTPAAPPAPAPGTPGAISTPGQPPVTPATGLPSGGGGAP